MRTVWIARGIRDVNELHDATADAVRSPVQMPNICVVLVRGYSRGYSSKYLKGEKLATRKRQLLI